jgi:hypothetical protein
VEPGVEQQHERGGRWRSRLGVVAVLAVVVAVFLALVGYGVWFFGAWADANMAGF